MHILRSMLCTVVVEWNHHIIFKRINVGPNGRLDIKFFLPHLYKLDSFLDRDIKVMYPHITNKPKDFSDALQEF